MSAEAEFRRAYEAALRRHLELLSYMASMSLPGISDEYMIVNGRSYWCELKAVSEWPKSENANVLQHRFSGPQLTFLRRVDRAGGRGLGVVGWKEGKLWKCACLRVHNIGKDGTVTAKEIKRHRPLLVDDWFHLHFLRLIERS